VDKTSLLFKSERTQKLIHILNYGLEEAGPTNGCGGKWTGQLIAV